MCEKHNQVLTLLHEEDPEVTRVRAGEAPGQAKALGSLKSRWLICQRLISIQSKTPSELRRKVQRNAGITL